MSYELKKPFSFQELTAKEIEYDGGKKLTGGEIAVITISCVIGAAAIGFGIYRFCRPAAPATSNVTPNVPEEPIMSYSERLAWAKNKYGAECVSEATGVNSRYIYAFGGGGGSYLSWEFPRIG